MVQKRLSEAATLVDLFREQKSADYETALLIAGPLRRTCRRWPGQPLAQHRPGDLIAINGGSGWVVMVAGDTATRQAFTVKRLIVDPKPDRPRHFAIPAVALTHVVSRRQTFQSPSVGQVVADKSMLQTLFVPTS